mgnify:CR=1 FL=1
MIKRLSFDLDKTIHRLVVSLGTLMKRIRLIFLCLLVSLGVQAQGLTPIQVTDGIWAVVGPKEQRNKDNLANNATFGVVITEQGTVLIDPGGSYLGAKALHEVIRSLTDQPVKHVVNTGGQDHRWLGNGYWKAQGAKIYASDAAVKDHHTRGADQLMALERFLGTELVGTEPVYADVTFATNFTLQVADIELQLIHRGQAHTPGDIFVWMPKQQVMFSGDIVYVERILGTGSQSSAKSWITVFEHMADYQPIYLIPGHGHPTDLATATRDTYDYLVNLRSQLGALIDAGGDILDAPQIDQSTFQYLEQFDSLAGRNAQTTFQQMEWE